MSYQISIIVVDQFTDIDFFLMRDILGRTTTDWNVKVFGTKSIHTSTLGQTIKTDGHLSEANKSDVVLFVSGYKGVPAVLEDREFMSSLILDPQKQIIGSVCAGSFILCRLGLLLTRRPNSSLSAAVCLPTARHQNAAVALLQQVLITRSVGRQTAACLLFINMLGASKQQRTQMLNQSLLHWVLTFRTSQVATQSSLTEPVDARLKIHE
jgi:putative intracellular protease/amidase